MNKPKVKMNKSVYPGLSYLDISKISMYEHLYDYLKPKSNNNVKQCYMETDTVTVHVKLKNAYADFAKDFETRFDASNFQFE